MPGTIVDRILAEYNTRKTTRDSILKRKIGGAEGASTPDATSGLPVRSPLPTSSTEHFIIRFKDELIPVIGSAVSSEVAQALSKVRTDLVDCLERQFRLLSPPTRTPVTVADRLDSTETDLDLPADEVNRQLNRVFAEMEPVGDGMPFAKTVIMPALDRFPPKEEPGLGEPSADTGELTPAIEDLTPTGATEPEIVALEVPAAVPEIGRGEKLDFLPWESAAPEEPSGGARAASGLLQAPFASLRAESISETELLSEAVAPPALADPLPAAPPGFEEEASTGSAASQFVQEIREALIPGIAAGISQILEELEKGQERMAKELSSLAGRVTGLEGRPLEIPMAFLPDPNDPPPDEEPPIPPFSAPEPVGPQSALSKILDKEWPIHPRALPDAVTEAAPIPAALLPHPVSLEEPAARRPSFDRKTEVTGVPEPALARPADLKEVILLELREMEKRLIKKIESLKARKHRKKAPAAQATPGADNFP